MDGLFATPPKPAPLADRMRPRSFDEFVGQEHIVAPLRRIVESGAAIPSIILWGPPGSGKTTLARLIARGSGRRFVAFSAVLAGIREVRQAVEEARRRPEGTILFVDEVHRFNRAQQDAFLPHVEEGTIVLIGATTENPSFEVNAPLLSRCAVYRLRALTDAEVEAILRRAAVEAQDDAIRAIASLAGGDARAALNILETAAAIARPVTPDAVRAAVQRRVLRYDKNRDEHYDTISAFIKSMRGGDSNAALYWLARMLEAGEDPLFIARRMVIFASEDVGNADPRALLVAVAAKEAVDFVGMPEAHFALAQAATYLATAPKSRAVADAYAAARADVEHTRAEPVPLHLRNPVTELMRREGYGAPGEGFMPPNLKGRVYYRPSE